MAIADRACFQLVAAILWGRAVPPSYEVFNWDIGRSGIKDSAYFACVGAAGDIAFDEDLFPCFPKGDIGAAVVAVAVWCTSPPKFFLGDVILLGPDPVDYYAIKWCAVGINDLDVDVVVAGAPPVFLDGKDPLGHDFKIHRGGRG